LNIAANIDAAREAVKLIVHASQNVLIAHRDGGIAWQVSGRLPLREQGAGSLPVPGWISGYRWRGYVPPQANPNWIDPPGGQLVSANNRSVAPDDPVKPGRSWMAPYRAQRVTEGKPQQATGKLVRRGVHRSVQDRAESLVGVAPELEGSGVTSKFPGFSMR